jgi:hypothetical protein
MAGIADFRLLMDIGRSCYTSFSIANLRSPIANPVRAARKPALRQKTPPRKYPKKVLTAHSVDAMLSVINASLVEVVNTQQSGEAGAIWKQGKASRGSRQ